MSNSPAVMVRLLQMCSVQEVITKVQQNSNMSLHNNRPMYRNIRTPFSICVIAWLPGVNNEYRIEGNQSGDHWWWSSPLLSIPLLVCFMFFMALKQTITDLIEAHSHDVQSIMKMMSSTAALTKRWGSRTFRLGGLCQLLTV